MCNIQQALKTHEQKDTLTERGKRINSQFTHTNAKGQYREEKADYLWIIRHTN